MKMLGTHEYQTLEKYAPRIARMVLAYVLAKNYSGLKQYLSVLIKMNKEGIAPHALVIPDAALGAMHQILHDEEVYA